MIIIVAVACGILIFLMFVFFIEYSRRNRATLNQRMKYYADGVFDSGAAAPPPRQKQAAERAMDFVKETAKHLDKVRRAESLDLKMQQAGLPILGSEFLVIAVVGAILTGVVVMMLTMQVSVAVLGAVAAALAEWFYVLYRIDSRRKAFVNQLGDCLTTVANAMRAGFSFLQAMELISKEMEPPISEEFGRAMREINLGNRMEKVLEEMDVRVGSPDYSLVVTAVLIQRQVGGNLAQILDTISNTINERIRMRRELMALTAQGRASGWILAGIPVGLAAILSVLNPAYLRPLIEEPIGHIAIGVAIVLEIIGFIVIQRIVDIEI
ncbi:MAG: type II secretion system F family protein [Schwartzia sp.]|nr:type II secretion system F family protein [Schwartzia sp. (in: firmicutes)]